MATSSCDTDQLEQLAAAGLAMQHYAVPEFKNAVIIGSAPQKTGDWIIDLIGAVGPLRACRKGAVFRVFQRCQNRVDS